MKAKKGIILVIIALAIGFATISTTLILNGILGIGTDNDDYKVYFSGAILEGVDMTNEIIKNQGQEIIYTSSVLNKAGQTSRLDYEVTNGSTQYGADVTIDCFLADADNHKIATHDYLEVLDGYTNEMELEPGETKPGYVVVKLKKSSIENDESTKLRCVIIANATEKDEYGNPVPNQGTYALSGYFVNDDGDSVSNAYLAVYSEEMHIVKTDLYGYFYVDGLERGLHEIYYLNSLNPTGLTKEEVRTYSYGEVKVATNNDSDIKFTNKYKITDTVISNSNNKTNKTYDITLNPDGGTLSNNTLAITENTRYGELPTPDRPGYNFLGWYLNDKLVNSDIIVTSDNISEIKAKWSVNSYTLTLNPNGGSVDNVSELTKTIEYNSVIGTLPEPTREHFIFDGWYKGNTKIESTTTYTYTDNIELEAKWTPVVYKVSYNLNGGTGTIVDTEKVADQIGKITSIVPTRDGYTFLGWGLTSNATEVAYTANADNTANESRTLYAIWNLNPILTLTKETYLTDDFSMWNLNNATIDNEVSLVLAQTGTAASGVNLYQINGSNWYIEFDGYSSSAENVRDAQVGSAGSGPGAMNLNSNYYDENYISIVSNNGYSSNGHAPNLPLNTWSNSFIWSGWDGYGENIKYLVITFSTNTGLKKVRNVKIHGEKLYSDFYTINYSGNKEGIKVVKYALGVKDKNYFKENGTVVTTGKFNVDENGTYTVYIEDNAGYSDIKTIVIDKIDKNAPTISAKEEQVFVKVGTSNSLISYFNYNKNGISDIIDRNTKCYDISDGNKLVSDTNELTLGSHNISCSVVKANNKYASATIKITIGPEQIKNLIVDGSFENNSSYSYPNSWNASISTSNIAKSGNQSLVLRPAEVSYDEAYVHYQTVPFNHTHKYYYSLYYILDSYVELWFYDYSYSLDSNRILAGNSFPPSTIWKKASMMIYNTNAYNSTNNPDVYVRFDNNNYGKDIPAYYDDILYVDLTEAFGAGNEPSQEWCDNHINWAEGNITINY